VGSGFEPLAPHYLTWQFALDPMTDAGWVAVRLRVHQPAATV